MELNIELIKFVCIVSIGASIVSTAIIQKIKESLKSKKYLPLICFLVSFIIGGLFTISFTSIKWYWGCWVGLFCWCGADLIYKTFEEKLFIPFSDMDDTEEVIIGDDDNV